MKYMQYTLNVIWIICNVYIYIYIYIYSNISGASDRGLKSGPQVGASSRVLSVTSGLSATMVAMRSHKTTSLTAFLREQLSDKAKTKMVTLFHMYMHFPLEVIISLTDKKKCCTLLLKIWCMIWVLHPILTILHIENYSSMFYDAKFKGSAGR